MFDTIFNAATSFNQAMLLAAGGFLLLLGGAITGNILYWRTKALRLTAKIIGVRQAGKIYYTVYEFMLPDGRVVQATSDSGSSLAKGRETGREADILVFENNPEKVRAADGYVFLAVGIVLLLAGCVMIAAGFAQGAVGEMTLLMLAGFFAALVVRVAKKWKSPDSRGNGVTAFRAEQKRKREERLGDIKKIEDIIGENGGDPARKTPAYVGPLMLALGLGGFCLAAYIGQETYVLETKGLRAEAEVVSIQTKSTSDGYTYRSVFRFRDAEGKSWRVVDKVSTNPAIDDVGEKVTALYVREKPQQAMIDRGLWNWLPSIGVATLSFLFTGVGLSQITRHRQMATR